MSNPQKQKGDAAEREAAQIIAGLTGFNVRRKLGAGRQDDQGDLEGVPATTLQVCAWKDVTRAIRVKPLECEQQQLNAASTFGASLVKLPREGWRVVMTLEQYCTYVRESLQ